MPARLRQLRSRYGQRTMILSLWRPRVPSYDHSGFPLTSTETTTQAPRKVFRWLEQVDGVDLALRLTLLTLLLRQIGTGMLRPLILGLAVLGLLLPNWLRPPELWGALTILTGLRVVFDWSLADWMSASPLYSVVKVTSRARLGAPLQTPSVVDGNAL